MRKYYSSLDLLKFIAALAVAFFFHYVIVLGGSPFEGSIVGDFFNNYGGYVVELFFVISGFVTMNAYASKIREGQVLFTNYLVDRIIRLYPPMVISVIAAAIPMLIGYGLWDEALTNDSKVSIIAILLNLFGLNGGLVAESAFVSVNGPSWYITVLLLCYVIFFATIKACKKSKAAENVVFLAVLLIGVFIYLNPVNAPFLSVSCARGYIFFFIGVFLSQLQSKLNWIGNIVMCLLSIGLVALFVFNSIHDNIMCEALEIGLAVVTPIVIFFINFIPLKFICNNPVVKFMGGCSFGIFLWNLPTLIWVKFLDRCLSLNLDYSNLTTYLIIAGCNLTLGILSYILVDKLLIGKLHKIVVARREDNLPSINKIIGEDKRADDKS